MGAVVALVPAVAAGLVKFRALHARLRRLEAEALTDPLTGAFNRRYLDRCLATAVERCTRLGEPASLLLIDVDRFKDINDAVGHSGGDRVLKDLVTLIQRRARKTDILCRVGGEEFALVLTGAGFVAGLDVAEQVRALVAGATLLDARHVSISVGVAELQAGQSAFDWFDDADAALYAAKRSGRNCVAGKDRGGPPLRYERADHTVKVSVLI